jgi:hypothetical protein
MHRTEKRRGDRQDPFRKKELLKRSALPSLLLECVLLKGSAHLSIQCIDRCRESVFLSAAQVKTSQAAESPAELDIRDPAGKVSHYESFGARACLLGSILLRRV